MVIVVMGPAGAGKTAVGTALARALGWRFVDGDAHHSAESIAKMRAGVGLTDDDRGPWLATLHELIDAAVGRREPLVLACSALLARYREVLRGTLRGIRFVYLKADAATLRERLTRRSGHFAGPALVSSQLAALEEPDDALTIDATRPIGEIVDAVRYEFGV